VAMKKKAVPYRPFKKKVRGKHELVGVTGVYFRHDPSCPAYRPENAEAKCKPCQRTFKAKFAGRWGAGTHDTESAAQTEYIAMRDGTAAVREQAAEGYTFGRLADEWLAGIKDMTIQRRRRGRPEPYSSTTLPDYERIVEILKDDVGLNDRLAAAVAVEEWHDIFDDLAKGKGTRSGKALSHSRRASIRSVASNIYDYGSQRALRSRTGVTDNPLVHVRLGANTGQRRDRVALLEEARDLLAALPMLDRVPFAIAMYGGPRRGDIRRSDWRHYEFVTTSDGRLELGWWFNVAPLEDGRGPGKVGTGRWVPMAPQLRAVLSDEWLRQGRPTRGLVVERSVIAGHLYKAADKAWVKANERRAEVYGGELRPREKHEAWGPEHMLMPIRLHECRHTFCSWLVRSKQWDLDTMMKFMGVSQVSTFQIYMHTVTEHGPRTRPTSVDVFGGGDAPYEG
jgi:integrase